MWHQPMKYMCWWQRSEKEMHDTTEQWRMYAINQGQLRGMYENRTRTVCRCAVLRYARHRRCTKGCCAKYVRFYTPVVGTGLGRQRRAHETEIVLIMSPWIRPWVSTCSTSECVGTPATWHTAAQGHRRTAYRTWRRVAEWYILCELILSSWRRALHGARMSGNN